MDQATQNCELSPADIQRIGETFLAFAETPQSKIFPNQAFGYWKVTVERPLRLHSQLAPKRIKPLRFASGDEELRAPLYEEFGDRLAADFAAVAGADPDLRDTEQVPLLEEGGIEAFIRREVLPYTPDAWVKEEATRIGYEISFTRHFYQPKPLRTLEEIRADILALEKESEGLLDELLKGQGA